MEFLTGGRQNGQIIHDALKLYNYINSLPDNTLIRCVKKDNICLLCIKKEGDKDEV